MLKLPKSEFTVPFDGSFKLDDAPHRPEINEGKKMYKAKLAECVAEMSELQRILYAHDKHALLLVFQAMDAAGKDSTIRAVMSGVDPTGCQVFSFKRPSNLELDHDFLWRSAKRLPERGRIGIFNRSYYEEVLVVRVHPGILGSQRIPELPQDRETIFKNRFESIRDHEKHLARNGTVIVKFFLNVSKEEQRNRFLSRLDTPEKNWKFELGDIKERKHWNTYMQCYEDAMNETSRVYAPWHCIPADNKPFMRLKVAEVVVETLKTMKLKYPDVDPDEREAFAETKTHLLQDL